MGIVQFSRFQISDAQEEWMLAAQSASVDSCRAEHPELQEVLLIRLEDRDWLDVALWAHLRPGEHPGYADLTFPPASARDDFFAQVEGLLGQEQALLMARSGPAGPKWATLAAAAGQAAVMHHSASIVEVVSPGAVNHSNLAHSTDHAPHP